MLLQIQHPLVGSTGLCNFNPWPDDPTAGLGLGFGGFRVQGFGGVEGSNGMNRCRIEDSGVPGLRICSGLQGVKYFDV